MLIILRTLSVSITGSIPPIASIIAFTPPYETIG